MQTLLRRLLFLKEMRGFCRAKWDITDITTIITIVIIVVIIITNVIIVVIIITIVIIVVIIITIKNTIIILEDTPQVKTLIIDDRTKLVLWFKNNASSPFYT